MSRLLLAWCMLTFLASGPSTLAEDGKNGASKKDEQTPAAEEKQSVTHHKTVVQGQEIKYTATAGKIAMKTDQGETKAHIFFIAYTKDDVNKLSQRPVTFCFNGGPGSSSVWLHLGMLGPKRVKLPDKATPLRPPYRLRANPYSLLDATDLVFIDPVSTGFSRPADEEDKRQFHGYDEDIHSVGQFIHDYTTSYGRWASPKFLIGESYGGLRAAGLAGHLQDRYKMELNGVVLVSAVLDFQTLRFAQNSLLPNILYLPSYATTAWYHQALPTDLQQLPLETVIEQVRRFAIQQYAVALLQGDSLKSSDRAAVVQQLASHSGLSQQYVDRAGLRVSMGRFAKELLRDRGKTVGRFDSRYLGIDRDQASDGYEYDPSFTAIVGLFTAAMNIYLRDDLKYEDQRVYEILTGNVHPWSYKGYENRYVDASETLRAAMTENPYLKVFVACGYYDLATPFFAMDYSVSHLGLAPGLRKNITHGYYPAGHMMYTHEPSLQQLRTDLLEFYEAAAP